MKRIGAAITAAIAVLATAPGAAAATAEQIEVRLFLAHSGSFSDPVSESSILWNTIIGGGDAREPSTSAFVKVQVSAQPSSFDKKAKVRLSIKTKTGRPATALAKPLGVFGPDGKQFVGFWLPNTGCEELHLEASTTVSNKTVKYLVPFRCGE